MATAHSPVTAPVQTLQEQQPFDTWVIAVAKAINHASNDNLSYLIQALGNTVIELTPGRIALMATHLTPDRDPDRTVCKLVMCHVLYEISKPVGDGQYTSSPPTREDFAELPQNLRDALLRKRMFS